MEEKAKKLLGPLYEVAQSAGEKLGNFINDLIDKVFEGTNGTTTDNTNTNDKNN